MKIFRWVTDVVYPPRATELLVRTATDRGNALPLHVHRAKGAHALAYYHDPLVRAAITEHKFHHNHTARALLEELLITWLITAYTDTPVVLIPIPLSTKRERTRGYNQVTVLADAAARMLPNVVVLKTFLMRTRDTVPQTALKKHERMHNMRGAFEITTPLPVDVPHGTYVVLDDVLTTGATMASARTTISPHLPSGITLHCVALAH